MNKETNDKLSKICELFDNAEKAIKSAEITDKNIVLTPINQLRYGFKHLTQAFKAYEIGDIEQFNLNISKTEGHCKRSYYDAIDVEMFFHIEQFDEFVKNSHDKGIAIHKIIPEYKNWASVIHNTKKTIESFSNIENKDDRYDEIIKLFGSIKNISQEIPGAYELINEQLIIEKRLQDELKASKIESANNLKIAKRNSLIATIALIATTTIAIVSVLNYFK